MNNIISEFTRNETSSGGRYINKKHYIIFLIETKKRYSITIECKILENNCNNISSNNNVKHLIGLDTIRVRLRGIQQYTYV